MTRRSHRQRRLGVLFAVPTTLALLGAFFAAPAMAGEPPAGASFQWKKASCAYNAAKGTMVKIGTIRTEVSSVSDPWPRAGEKSRYYQLVKVQIDRLAGFKGDTWRKVSLKKWSWSRFTTSELPTYSTSAVRTGMGNDAGTFSAKATVRLKRAVSGPDLTVFRYTTRTRPFTCGFGAPGEAPPSAGGG